MADLGEAGLRSAGRAGRSRQRMCCVCVVVLSFSLARLLLVRPVRQLLLLLLGQFETGPGGSLDSVGVGLGEPRAGEREREATFRHDGEGENVYDSTSTRWRELHCRRPPARPRPAGLASERPRFASTQPAPGGGHREFVILDWAGASQTPLGSRHSAVGTKQAAYPGQPIALRRGGGPAGQSTPEGQSEAESRKRQLELSSILKLDGS